MNKRRLIIAAVALNACLYAAFLLQDFTQIGNPISTWLKYVGILLCAAIALLSQGGELSCGRLRLLQLAMLLTLLADTFLLLLGWAAAGLAAFCAVQAVHIVRFTTGNLRRPPVALLLAIPEAVALYLLLCLFGVQLDEQIAVSVLYAPLLLTSVGSAIISAVRRRFPLVNGVLMAVGMVLFLLCDINVALYNLFPASSSTSNAALLQIWLYYLPAQTLLALSGLRFARVSSL